MKGIKSLFLLCCFFSYLISITSLNHLFATEKLSSKSPNQEMPLFVSSGKVQKNKLEFLETDIAIWLKKIEAPLNEHRVLANSVKLFFSNLPWKGMKDLNSEKEIKARCRLLNAAVMTELSPKNTEYELKDFPFVYQNFLKDLWEICPRDLSF